MINCCAVGLWLAVAACGGQERTSTTPGRAPAGDARRARTPCERAIEEMFDVVAANEKPEDRARASKVFVHRCTDDGWSAEVQQCMLDVKAPADADRCEEKLTKAQRDNLARELGSAAEAAGIMPEVQSGKPKRD